MEANALVFPVAPAQQLRFVRSTKKIAMGWLHVIRFAIAVAFVWAGLLKLRNPFAFLAGVYDYRLLPRTLAVYVAAMLPWFEVILGVLLLLGWCKSAATRLSLLLICTFAFAVTSAWLRGLTIGCACFGETTGDLIGVKDVVRVNGLLIAGCVLVLADWRSPTRETEA